jgi:hypothetical protein
MKAYNTPLITLKCAHTGVLNVSLASKRGLMAAVLDNATTRIYSMEGSRSLVEIKQKSAVCSKNMQW